MRTYHPPISRPPRLKPLCPQRTLEERGHTNRTSCPFPPIPVSSADPTACVRYCIDRRSWQSTRARPLPLNPYNTTSMRDNLHSTRTGQAYSGNHTASRTVLGDSSRSGSGSPGITGMFGGHKPAPKRQKTSHPGEGQSQYFANGGEWLVVRSRTACVPERLLVVAVLSVVCVCVLCAAAGTGTGTGTGAGKGRGKGKGKELTAAPASKWGTVSAGTMEPIVVSDEDEVPERVILESGRARRSTTSAKEGGERHSSSDPLDCIGQDLSPDKPKPSEPPNPFDRTPSPPPRRPSMNTSRLPPDGAHTRQLQKKHQLQRLATPPEVVDVDSDSIQSASWFDQEDETEARAAAEAKAAASRPSTPNGRTAIPQGSVKNMVQRIEGHGSAKPSPDETPFLDLNTIKPKSRKAGMKGKNQKVAWSISVDRI